MRILINGYHFGSNTPPYLPAFRSRGHDVRLTTAAAFGIRDLERRQPLSPLLSRNDLLLPEYSPVSARLLRAARAARIPIWRHVQSNRMKVLLDDFRPDIIWNHSLWIDTDVMVWTGFHPQVTVPYGYNEVQLHPGRARVRRRIYAECDAFIDAVPEFRRFFTEQEGIPDWKFPPETLYLGVPGLGNLLRTDRAIATDLRQKLGIDPHATVLLDSRGLRQADGGAHSAIHALRSLLDHGLHVHLILLAGILGDATVCERAARTIEDLGVRNNVTLVRETLSASDLIRHYALANIYLSLLPSDVLGKSVMEAGALGCQLVLTDLPDYRRSFGDFASYVDSRDIRSIVSAIRHVISTDPDELAYRTVSIRRWLSDHQDFDSACDKILEYFEQVIHAFLSGKPAQSR